MIFNSYFFIFFFLFFSLILFYLIHYFKKSYAIYSIIFSSLIFYSISSFKNFFLLIIILAINFLSVKLIKNKLLFILVIFLNLLILVYFKFFKFLFDASYNVIPLALSFYIFNQIAFIIDCYYKRIKKPDFKNFLFLISFFPHLIAGPFLRYNPIISQLKNGKYFLPSYDKFFFGLLIFSAGLFKKVVIADTLGFYVDIYHQNLDSNLGTSFLTSWLASFAYTFQLYFDFSGYSDMAIGISLFFGILLPSNFNSPFKSINIIDFWNRWHITLGKYIFEFIYIPLVYLFQKITNFEFKFLEIIKLNLLPLLISFVIVGLWHSSGRDNFATVENFFIFGLIHGLAAIFSHLLKDIQFIKNKNISNFLGVFFTFNIVNFSLIFFRSNNFSSSIKMLKSMFCLNFTEDLYNFSNILNLLKISDPLQWAGGYSSVRIYFFLTLLIFSFGIVFFTKNLNNFSSDSVFQKKILNNKLLTKTYIIFFAILFAISLFLINERSSFIYFNF